MATPENELYELLKSSASTKTPDNEDESNPGMENTYVHIPDSLDLMADANTAEPHVHTTGAHEANKDVRFGVLGRSFAGKTKADAEHMKCISKNFAHGASGDYTTHSTHLQSKPVEKVAHLLTATLMERVKSVAGRH